MHKLKAVHCSQRDLLALLWSEYNRKKLAPFAVYRCHKGTTEEDLSLFFSRVQQFRYVQTFCLNNSVVYLETSVIESFL